jgi:hypothetical protein
MQNSEKASSYRRIIGVNCLQRRNLFIPKSQYSVGGRRSVQQIKARACTPSVSGRLAFLIGSLTESSAEFGKITEKIDS